MPSGGQISATGPVITTEQAEINTVSVTIKSLMVSKKQMTMGVFRQLRKEPLFDRISHETRGIPWGVVHYFWGACKEDHLHIVWQKGEELRRDCVYPDPLIGSDKVSVLREGIDYIMHDLYEYRIAFGKEGYFNVGRMPRRDESIYIINSTLSIQGFPYHVEVILQPKAAARYAFGGQDEWAERITDSIARDDSPSLEDVEQEFTEIVESMGAAMAEYKRIYEGLASLDQLFIAV